MGHSYRPIVVTVKRDYWKIKSGKYCAELRSRPLEEIANRIELEVLVGR